MTALMFFKLQVRQSLKEDEQNNHRDTKADLKAQNHHRQTQTYKEM